MAFRFHFSCTLKTDNKLKNIKKLLKILIKNISKLWERFGLFESVFVIFYSIEFENSPLFPASAIVKSVQKQFSNNREIIFNQLLKYFKITC